MARYVLGESAARKLRSLLSGKMRAGRVESANGGMVDDYDYLSPFSVRWAASLAGSGEGTDSDGEWIVWLPGDKLVTFGGIEVDVSESLEEAGGEYPDGWFRVGVDVISSSGGDLWLNVTASEDVVVAELSGSRKVPESGEDVVSVLVATVSRSVVGEVRVFQFVSSAVVISKDTTDGISISRVTASEEQGGGSRDSGSGRPLQIKDFDNDESNGRQGLAQRLKVVKNGDDIRIEADGSSSEVFLLARVNGRLKYIPLTGSSDPDEDEPQEGGGSDPCDHPGGGSGSGGGVPAGGGAGMEGESQGGVPADGESHPGRPCTGETC